MSVRIMSAVWDMPFSPVEKLILLALADWANDDGVAWPSIAQLARKTGCGERTVQRTLREAEKTGLLVRHENPGKGCSYRINPRHAGTPAAEAPVPQDAQTPATLAPNTLLHISSQKTSSSSKRARAPKSTFCLPDSIPAKEWAEYEEMRRVIRKPMTDAVRQKAVDRLAVLAADGWPPGVVLNHSILNSYQGLFPPKDDRNGKSGTNSVAGNWGGPASGSRAVNAGHAFIADGGRI